MSRLLLVRRGVRCLTTLGVCFPYQPKSHDLARSSWVVLLDHAMIEYSVHPISLPHSHRDLRNHPRYTYTTHGASPSIYNHVSESTKSYLRIKKGSWRNGNYLTSFSHAVEYERAQLSLSESWRPIYIYWPEYGYKWPRLSSFRLRLNLLHLVQTVLQFELRLANRGLGSLIHYPRLSIQGLNWELQTYALPSNVRHTLCAFL